MKRATILGTGMYVPPRQVTNDELASIFETSDEWIVQRTGISTRYFADDGVGASDLGLEASRMALENAGIGADQLDLILFATLSPDINFPGSSCLLQAKLGVKNTATLDIRNQCTGFIYGLAIAEQFIATGRFRYILVVGAEVHSSGMDFSDRGRDIAVLFGDGAGAVVLGPSPDSRTGVLATSLHADGTEAESLWCEAPQSRRKPRIDGKMIEEGRHFPIMNGRHVFRYAVEKLPETILESLARAELGIEDVDLLVPHQANLRINEFVAKKLGMPSEKVFNNIQHYGNTTAASIPIALHEALISGHIRQGSLVMLAAFGSGFTWGSALLRW